MTSQDAQKSPTPNSGDGLVDEEISDEEANEEIDFPATAFVPPAPPVPKPTPAPRPALSAPPRTPQTADDTTPSVKVAIDKAADVLRELRGER